MRIIRGLRNNYSFIIGEIQFCAPGRLTLREWVQVVRRGTTLRDVAA